jgi:hypothetical protein
MAINWEKQLAFMLERIQKLENGIQITSTGCEWQFCPEDVIDRLKRLENVVFHKPSDASRLAIKQNLQARLQQLRREMKLINEEIIKIDKEYNEMD